MQDATIGMESALAARVTELETEVARLRALIEGLQAKSYKAP
jgi:uncharacterized protein YceH (UPF0502 family)